MTRTWDPNPDYDEAIALQNAGRLEEGLAHYARALEHQPDRPRIHSNTARVLLLLARPEEALASARRGAELAAGEDPYASLVLAQACEAARLEEEALQRAEEAVAHRSSWPELVREALLLMTRVKLDRGVEGALGDARKAVAVGPPSSECFRMLARALAKHDRWGDAMEVLRRGLELDPADEKLKSLKRSIAQGLAVVDAELAKARDAALAAPQDWEAQHQVAVLLFMLGRHVEAAEAFDLARTLHPQAKKMKGTSMLSTYEADCKLELLRVGLEPNQTSRGARPKSPKARRSKSAKSTRSKGERPRRSH